MFRMTPFKAHLIGLANIEFGRWTRPNNSRAEETDRTMFERQRAYWSVVRGGKPPYTDAQLQNQDANKLYWSAAFICYLFKQAGAGNQFKYAIDHATYIHAARANLGKDPALYPFQAFPIHAVFPEPGDVLCAWSNERRRGEGAINDWIDINPRHYEHYAAHCDLIVAVNAAFVSVIGGNVPVHYHRNRHGHYVGGPGLTVNKRIYGRNPAGFVIRENGLAIIKNYK